MTKQQAQIQEIFAQDCGCGALLLDERTVDRMTIDGRLPPPILHRPIPDLGRGYRLTPATVLPRCCRVRRAPHENGRPIARAAGRVSVG